MTRTQLDMLLDHLRLNGPRGVTALDAYGWGCMRLAARVADLRAQGYDVRTETTTTAAGARIARYVLVERPQMSLRLGVAS